jgi:hypothetical protein
MALKDEVALIEEAVWIEDNRFAERPSLRYFTENAIFHRQLAPYFNEMLYEFIPERTG